MTYRVIFDVEAQEQLESIYNYVAESATPTIAFDFVTSISDYCQRFETHPRRGTRRDDLAPGLRTVGFRRRVTIAFVVDDNEKTVTILGVYYGGQSFEARWRPT